MDVVVGALSGMVDALPGKLGELLEQEYALLSGVRDDVRLLQAELDSMRGAIRHCESLDHHDAQRLDRVWRQAEHVHGGVLAQRPGLRDLCLSYSLFKLLRRRLSGHPLADAGSGEALDFVLRGMDDGAGVDVRAALGSGGAGSEPLAERYELVVAALSARPRDKVLRRGAELGRRLVEEYARDEPSACRILVDFWSEMVIYLAPSENAKGHVEAMARGGEFITLVWALLLHAGVTTRPDTPPCVIIIP